jgi:iron complex transport system substrate-binding protein
LINHHAILIIIFITELLFSGGCQKNKQQEFGSGNRIISLAPHITEIIYALDEQDQLIAVTDYCHYPEEAEKKEKIGGLLNPNIEKMVRLKPTLLLGLPSHEKLNLELQKFGLTVTMMPNENIADVFKTINKIGMMIGHADQAHELVNQINARLDTLKMNAIKKTISAVLMIGREEGTLRNIMAAGNDTYIDELWRLVGGVNSYSDLPNRYGSINIESLLLRDPEVIIVFDMKKNKGVTRMQISPEWKYVENLSAVKNKNIFEVGGDHTMIPGPRMVLLAEDFSNIIKRVSGMNESPTSDGDK